MREARERDNNYQHIKKIVKFDPRRNQRNRTFEKRLEFNKRKLQIYEAERQANMITKPKSYTNNGKIQRFYPQNIIDKLIAQKEETDRLTQISKEENESRINRYNDLLRNLVYSSKKKDDLGLPSR